MRRVLRRVVIGGAALVVAMQLVPYGWRHPNPPVTEAAVFPSAEAEELARGACMDCHSNETDWPAYSYVAPASWLVRRDVEEGRDKLNLSEWDGDHGEIDEAADTIEHGKMPPDEYKLLHPDARLSEEERQILIEAFEALDDSDARGEG